jgi:hypothetical protein
LDSMLLNELQRQQATAERQQAEIRNLQQQISELRTALASVSGSRTSNIQ